MKYVILPVVVVFVALRLWIRLRKRARGAGSSGPTDTVRTKPVAAFLDRVLGGDIGLVARREVRERMRGRTFRVGTAIILLAVAAAVTIPVLRRGHNNDQEHVAIVGTLSAPLRAAVISAGPELGIKVRLVSEASLAAAKRDLVSGRVVLALVDARRILVDQYIDPSDASTMALLVGIISRSVSLQAGLEHAGIPAVQAAQLAHPPGLPVHSLQPPKRNQTGRSTAVYGLILTYVLLTTYGTWLLMGVVEEKSSRVIEVLLSTLRPSQLLAGKVIGIGSLALLQAALIVGVALGLGAAVGSDLIHGTAALGVVSSLVWVVLGYAFYCWVYAAGGSLADRQEQVQSLAFPLQLPILFGYIVSFTALGSGQASALVKVLAFLPPTAPFAMPVLVGLGSATWWEFTVSVVLMLAAIAGVAWLASTVYRRAILRTGGRVHLRQLFSARSA